MNDDLERRLQDSLRTRAQDVEPTPELYRRVEAKMNRSKRWTWALSAAGVAAAVAIGAVTIPALLADDRLEPPDITDTPAPTPTSTDDPTPDPSPDPSPTADPGSGVTVADHVVLSGDDRIWLADITSGDEVAELVNFQSPENESDIVAVEVRPGSTVDDLTVVYVLKGEGTFTFGSVTYDGSQATNAYFPDAYQPSADLVGDALPIPAFDPTGTHLAWIEPLRGEDNQAPVLQTIGWSNGPGTDESATDNASFTLHAIPIEHPPSDFVVDDWVWTQQADGERRGNLTVTGAGEAWTVAITEQGDGALTTSGGSQDVTLLTHPDGAIFDRAHALGGDQDGATYVLLAGGSTSQDAEDANVRLERLSETDGAEQLPVPDFVQQTASPSDIWMTVYGDGYAIGLGGLTQIFLPDGQYPFDATYADFVR